MNCDVALGLNVTRNALMLAALCGGVTGVFKYVEVAAKADQWYVKPIGHFALLLLIPLGFSVASAISGNYSLVVANVFFTISCSFFLWIIFTYFLYVLWLAFA